MVRPLLYNSVPGLLCDFVPGDSNLPSTSDSQHLASGKVFHETINKKGEKK